MLKNYIKAAVRNLTRNKVFSMINVFGLAIGLTCALFIGLWVHDEYAYDRFHTKGDRLYQVINEIKFNEKTEITTNTPVPLAEVLQNEITGIEQVVRASNPHQSQFLYRDKKIEEKGIYADQHILDVFDFEIVQGQQQNPLKDKFSLVITESLAEKLFPGENAIGKSVTVDDWGYRNDFTVTGIVELPAQSSLKFEYIIPYATYLDHRPWYNDAWGLYNEPMFVLLEKGASKPSVEEKFAKILFSHNKEIKATSHLYAFKDLYLYSNFTQGLHAEGRIVYVRIFIVIGVFILLIACINFMNLSTARASQRAKEVGVRKTIGASKRNLISQFIGESIMLALISGALAVTFTNLLLPFFNQLTEKSIILPLTNPDFIMLLISGCCFTGILAGTYPAIYLSAFQPSSVLKGVFKGGKAFGGFRRALVILQFALSTLFIISTIFVYQQFQYVMNKDLGGKKEHILYHHLNGILGDPTAYKNEVAQLPGVNNVTVSTSSPYEGQKSTTISVEWPGKATKGNITFDIIQADENFVNTFGLKFKSRSNIPLSADTANLQYLVNEKAAAAMGLEEPLGASIAVFDREGEVVGVLEDFHNRSLFETIGPVIIPIVDQRIFYAYIDIKPGLLNETIPAIKQIYNKHESNYPFDYSFIDQD
ncbi:MAG: ABC transporter permease, partial [Fulvivirga sp.]|nr:ABC transporter permease [Fulvivirga sp.]